MSFDIDGRICTACSEKKPWDAFHRQSKSVNGRRPVCRACTAKRVAERKEVNREHIREIGTASKRRTRAQCPEKERAVAKAWRERNKEKVSERNRRYYAENKARVQEAVRKYNAEHVGEAKAWQQNYRARRRAGGSLTGDDMRRVLSSSAECFYCEAPYTDRRRPTVDHIVPLSRGGTNTCNNLVSCCRSCNSSKKNRTVSEWTPPIGGARIIEKMATLLASYNATQ